MTGPWREESEGAYDFCKCRLLYTGFTKYRFICKDYMFEYYEKKTADIQCIRSITYHCVFYIFRREIVRYIYIYIYDY